MEPDYMGTLWGDMMTMASHENRERILMHLRLDESDTTELQLVQEVYFPAAWEHCQDFCNRTVVQSSSWAEDLAADAYPVRSPVVADRRFLAAVLMTLAYFYAQREDTGDVPKVVERLLWPLRARMGV